MRGEYQIKIAVPISAEQKRRLEQYCTRHGIKQSEAVRKAIARLTGGPYEWNDLPVFDKNVPL